MTPLAGVLMLAGLAVFALALLPAHGSTNPQLSSDTVGQPHPSSAHAMGHHDTESTDKDGHSVQPRHAQGLHEAHADVPLCHGGQTSTDLSCAKPGTANPTHLLTLLLAAGLAVVLFVVPLPRAQARAKPPRRSKLPIRVSSGPRLLLLDCIARV